METSKQLLKLLKVKINSEEHTDNEWREILNQLGEIAEKVKTRLIAIQTHTLERVEIEESDDKQ